MTQAWVFSPDCHLNILALYVPIPGQRDNLTQRLRRWLKNQAVTQERIYIPLAWRLNSFGGTGNEQQKELLAQVAPLLAPLPRHRITFYGDSEFRAVDLQIYCRDQGWHWYVGLKSDILYYQAPHGRQSLGSIPMERGQRRYLHKIILTKGHLILKALIDHVYNCWRRRKMNLRKSVNQALIAILLLLLFLLTTVSCNTVTESTIAPTEASEIVAETIVEAGEPAEELAEESAIEEKVLVIGHLESSESYDPAHGLNPTSMMVNHSTYDTLVTFLDSGASSIEPDLATSWAISDDGLIYTFTLREDVIFANGDPLTADDVVFSFNRLKSVKSNPSYLADPIASVEEVDENTVKVTLVEPRPSFLAELVQPVFSIANDDEIIAAGGTDAKDAATSDHAQEFLDQNSVGTGPYMLESWAPQDETVLIRNPNYWGEQPYHDRVIIINMPEAATQKIALESGDIDVATDLSPDQVAELEGNSNLTIHRDLDRFTHYLVMNRDPEIGGPVSDPAVAMAIRHALDYDGYTELWTGGVTPGSNMWIGLPGAFGPDRAFERDLDRARELLAEAGYPDGFEFELSYPDVTFGGINFNTNAQKIQHDLAEVGITIDLRPQEVQVSQEEYRNGEQGFGYWVWNPDVLDPADFLSFLPGGTVAADRIHWGEEMVDPEILDLIAQTHIETDPEARVELFEQLQTYAQESGPYAPFLVATVQTAMRSDIEGYFWNPAWGIDIASLSRSE